MQFQNLTPFGALCFSGVDLADAEFRVVVMKVRYRLRPDGNAPLRLVVEHMPDEPVALCPTDGYYGELNCSSVREESDYIHFKPRCDVVVRGSAHAPGGAPQPEWISRIRVSVPPSLRHMKPVPISLLVRMMPALSPRRPERWAVPSTAVDGSTDTGTEAGNRILLDKSLRFTGCREFVLRDQGWHLTAPASAASVPLRWEYSFGGSSVVRNPRYGQRDGEPEFLLNEACYVNPLGRGWAEARHATALDVAGLDRVHRMSAPQIETIDDPVRAPCVVRHPDQIQATDPDAFIRIAQGYGRLPAGFGIVGRSWVPRLQLAGTYDAQWLQSRWPYLPEDFDFGYWNGAPRDQQIAAPSPHARVELWNLVDPAIAPQGYICFDLPGDYPFVRLRMRNGDAWPMPMHTDTMLIDTDEMTLTLVHRIAFVPSAEIRQAEACLARPRNGPAADAR